MPETLPDTATFGERLDDLIRTVPAPDGSLWSHSQLAAAMTAAGSAVSPSYISQLRNGIRDNPTVRTVEGLSLVFDVSPSYFMSKHEPSRADFMARFGVTEQMLMDHQSTRDSASGFIGLCAQLSDSDKRLVVAVVRALSRHMTNNNAVADHRQG